MGTQRGRGDLVRSGRLQDPRYVADGLPSGQPLYARVLTLRGGVTKHIDLTFVASPQAAEWVHPRPGSADVNPRRAIEWTLVPEADEYSIAIGTEPGRFDLVNLTTGKLTQWHPSRLPLRRRLFGRIGTRIGSVWRYRVADFAFELGYRPASPIQPAPNQTADGREPFAWSSDPMAGGYRLRIGSAEGQFDLYDSGPIGVTQRFVAGLPPGQRLFATLTTLYADRSLDTHFTFRAATAEPGESEAVLAALSLTASMHGMAGYAAAWPRTILDQTMRDAKATGPGCVEYAVALLRALSDQNNPLPVRVLNTCLLGNLVDCHTLVELYRPSRREWMILDPTFAVAARRRRDGDWATASDIRRAVRREDWRAISYVPLGPGSLASLRSYYIDYPLLFVSPFGSERPTTDDGPSILRYYVEARLPVRGQPNSYAVKCADGEPAQLLVDGKAVTLACSGRDGLSPVIRASSIELPEDAWPLVRIYRLKRFVF